jgi:hypothetical protein
MSAEKQRIWQKYLLYVHHRDGIKIWLFSYMPAEQQRLKNGAFSRKRSG